MSHLKESLNPFIEQNIKRIFASGEGMGKSGSFFFFSHDTNFLIKTMFSHELPSFQKLFKTYFEHINVCPQSILARIYGLYSVQMEDQDPVYLILMGNSKKCDNDFIKKIYDLKGSMSKREVFKGLEKNTAVLKDKNLLHLKQEEKCILFQTEDIRMIMN